MNRFTPLDHVKLKGSIAEHMERFFHERIRSEEAHKVVYAEAENAFRSKLDDASGVYGIWQGEFWGKWIISAVRCAEYSGDQETREFIRQGVEHLIALQEPSGYLGTYRDPMNVFAADVAKTEPLLGWKCDWNWNIWCRKYTLWGMLEAYRLLGDPRILESAEKQAEFLIHSLHEHNIALRETGTFFGMPSGSILKPMVLLYEYTQKSIFLDFAKEIAADWDRADNTPPNLIANALSGKPPYQWYPEPQKWAKVYEMLSCWDGILRLFRHTGEKRLLDAAIQFRRTLMQGDSNALFSVGFNDMLNHAAARVNALTEPCDVIHWLRFLSELFLLTDDKSCLDDMELAFYNAFLASVYRDGRWGARAVRSHGHHFSAPPQAGLHHNHCCVNNIPRGAFNFAQSVLTTNGNELSLNFFTDAEVSAQTPDGGSIRLNITGNYLQTGSADVECNAELSAPVTLRIRIPRWAAAAQIDGSTVSGDWFRTELKSGLRKIHLQFERQPEIRFHEELEEPVNSRAKWESGEGAAMQEIFRTKPAWTIVYGPVLLARSKFIGNTEDEMFASALPAGFQVKLSPEPHPKTRCAWRAEISADGRHFTTHVCDYASAGDAKIEDPKFFSVFF